MKEKTNYKSAANVLIYLGVSCSIVFLIIYLGWSGELNGGNIDIDKFSSFGSIMGGVVGILFSLAGVILILQTINEQDEDFTKQKIEGRFFQLLSIQRENVKDMELKGKEGRNAVIWMQRELFEAYNVARYISYSLANPKGTPMEEIAKTGTKSSGKYILNQEQLIEFSYLAFFYGCIEKNKQGTFREQVRGFDDEYVNAFIEYCTENRGKIGKKINAPHMLFAGHQLRLGHYYRHLYQMVNYIDKQPNNIVKYKEKYQYIKTLRAQMTNQEQVLFFFNSLAGSGKAWERNQTEFNNKLVTKYNLIKNIPKNYALGIDLKQYYPDVKFEGETKSKNRLILEEKYT